MQHRTLGTLSVSAIGTLRRAHAAHHISAVQSEYSLWTRDPEDGVLEENVAALDVVLDANDLAELDTAFPQDVAAGTRYPEAGMKLLRR